jgi:hypothetical protein
MRRKKKINSYVGRKVSREGKKALHDEQHQHIFAFPNRMRHVSYNVLHPYPQL